MYGQETQGNFHVKICGTNWLEAMKIAAVKAPALYREVHKFALGAFAGATAYYHVTTDLSKVPDIDKMADEDLVSFFSQNDARQLIHITYGPILSAKNPDGSFRFCDRLYKLWRNEKELYTDNIDKHVSRHLELLYKHKNAWPK